MAEVAVSSTGKDSEPDKVPPPVEPITLQPAVSDQEKELALSAHQDFEKGNYEACANTLSKLASCRPNDPKVLHNKAVVDYYASGFQKTDDFKAAISEICTMAHVNIDNVESLDDVDHCVVFFNQAVILYHLQQYHAAIAILDKVFQFIEPLEESLARKVCFLLLELYLCTHQPEKALGLIGYIENLMFGSSKNSSSDSKGTSTPADKDKESDKDKENGKEQEGKNGQGNIANEIYRPLLQQYKARCYLMLRSAKACKREIKGLMSSSMAGKTDVADKRRDKTNLMAIYLRSQLEYLRGNHRKALKVLNTSVAPSSQHPFKDTGDNLAAMYYNNVGCIHFYMGKPNLGCFYFNKALREHENALKSVTTDDSAGAVSIRPLHTLGVRGRYQLLYNMGIQYLHAGHPVQAFDCLVEAIQVYHMNPRLWLRLAECCIQASSKDNSYDFHLKDRKKDMLQGTIGSGPHRKLLLSPCLSNSDHASLQGQPLAVPLPTLEFAMLCLCNALLLFPEEAAAIAQNGNSSTPGHPVTSVEESEVSSTVENSMSVLAPPSNTAQGSEIANLKNSILAASAYVALCLGDVMIALKHAEMLLKQPRLSGAHRLLGQLYAAEALILLDRISDAVQHLNPEQIKDVSLVLPAAIDHSDCKPGGEKVDESSKAIPNLSNWYPNTISTAKIIMQYNLTVAYALRGEFDKASETLRQVGVSKGPGTDIPVQALMLAIYIQLQQGHADLAKSIVKQHLPQYRVIKVHPGLTASDEG